MASLPLDSLTPREREILTLIAEGDSLPEIAQKLHRSLKTIETHRLSIGRKLRASNRVTLARMAIEMGLVSVTPTPRQHPTAASQGESVRPKIELDWLEQISTAVYSATGYRYINALCNAISGVLGVRYCAVCMPSREPGGTGRWTVSISEDGRMLDPIAYDGHGSPARTAVEQGVCIVPNAVRQAYPDDAFLRTHGIESYVGIRLDGGTTNSGSVLAIAHDQALEFPDSIERVTRFFAARTAAELERIRSAEMLHDLRQQLQHPPAPDEPMAAGGGVPSLGKRNRLDQVRLLLGSLTGAEYLREITNALCEVFGVRYAGVCVEERQESGPGFMAISMSEHASQIDLMRYTLADTPCEQTIEHGYYCVSKAVRERFPNDESFTEMGIEAYSGVRLVGRDGARNGIMWVLDDKPFTEPRALEHMLRLLAPRTGAEVEQLNQSEALRELVESLEARVEQQASEIKVLRDRLGGEAG